MASAPRHGRVGRPRSRRSGDGGAALPAGILRAAGPRVPAIPSAVPSSLQGV